MNTGNDQGTILRNANNAKYAGKYAEAAKLYREAADIEFYPDFKAAMIEGAEECEAKANAR